MDATPASDAAPARRSSPWIAAVTVGLAAAFLLGGYEFVRSTSNTLFKQAYGAKNLPVVMAIMPLGLIAALFAYGRVLSRLGPRRTLAVTAGASALGFAACFAAYSAGLKPAAGALYVLREVYVVLLIEQYWSFLNSTLGESDARKLNGPICGLGSIGSILGAMGVAAWSKALGVPALILCGAGLILPAMACMEWAFRACGEPRRPAHEPEAARKGLELGLFGKHRMLPLLLAVILATQVLSAVLDLSFQIQLEIQEPSPEKQNALSGWFFAWLNAAAAVGQFVVAPLLLRFASKALVHLAIPLVHVATCALLFQDPCFATAGLAYMCFKALDYSVFRAAKEILYIPYPFDVRYRAKEVIDVFGYRFGKGAMSLAIALGTAAGIAFSTGTYALIGAGAAAIWLVLIQPATRPPDDRPAD